MEGSQPPRSGPPHQRNPSQGGSQGGGPSGPPQRHPSVSGPPGPARRLSPQTTGNAPKKTPFPPSLGYDPARDPKVEASRADKDIPNRIDLPPEAYGPALSGLAPYARRPAYNDKDKPVNLKVNQYRVEQAGNIKVFQYAVAVIPEPTKRIVYRKCFESQKVQRELEKFKNLWLYDGRSLAWSVNNAKDPIRINVDLDEEQGRSAPRPGLPRNAFIVTIKQTSTIYLESLVAYLRGTAGWDTHILECMNFFDHALRMKPSLEMTAIRRNFYHADAPKRALDGTVYAAKGIYAAFRLSESIRSGGSGLGINVDVANTTFWKDTTLAELVKNYLEINSEKWTCRSHLDAVNLLRPVQDPNSKVNEPIPSDAFKALRKLHKLRFTVDHRGKTGDKKVYTIARFANHRKFGFEGATSKMYSFEHSKTHETRTVYDHYLRQYNIPLQYFDYPVVETTRDGAFPIEVCHVIPWQRYPFKLNPAQTSDMIRFAVTRPAERGKSIADNVRKLGWNKDEYLQNFGIRVNPNMTAVQGRLLQPPSVAYKNGMARPGTSGRWDLRQKIFHINNQSRPLSSWGIAVVDGCVDAAAVSNFVRVFMKTYKDHGGVIPKPPHVSRFPRGKALAEVYLDTYNATVNANGGQHPVILFFVLPNKNGYAYYRLKKSGECRFGMVSQMLNMNHVLKAQPQYCSNVCMKVNAKLGGTTCRVPAEGGNPAAPAFFKAPTMIIGVDVGHGSVNIKGELEPSMAAMSISWDKDASKYAAFCQTNGYRVEILNPARIESMFDNALRKWCETLSCKMPAHVFYFRDGVSEGQFSHVMDYEIAELKRIFLKRCGKVPQFTVIVATKRHHIRFFPEANAGDRNGNPLPGTLVEKEVTHPYHYDFYLCSHAAIQGTARPVHYHVIHDEIKMPPHLLQQMIYQQCYQYARSTTPVSLHPAVYYAHLAGDRARAHENIESDKRDPTQMKKDMQNWAAKNTSSSRGTHPTEAPPLLPFGSKEAVEMNKSFTPYTMWFI